MEIDNPPFRIYFIQYNYDPIYAHRIVCWMDVAFDRTTSAVHLKESISFCFIFIDKAFSPFRTTFAFYSFKTHFINFISIGAEFFLTLLHYVRQICNYLNSMFCKLQLSKSQSLNLIRFLPYSLIFFSIIDIWPCCHLEIRLQKNGLFRQTKFTVLFFKRLQFQWVSYFSSSYIRVQTITTFLLAPGKAARFSK